MSEKLLVSHYENNYGGAVRRLNAIAAQLAECGCQWNAFVLEDLAPRPLIDMPAPVLADMESSQLSIFAVQVQPNELPSRMQMTDVVNRRRMRHAHMVNITPEIMCQGMRADYALVDRLSQQVLDRVRNATRIASSVGIAKRLVTRLAAPAAKKSRRWIFIGSFPVLSSVIGCRKRQRRTG